jgi:hypothetical protein
MKPYCIPVEHLNDSNSQYLCLWGAVSSILTVPDGMGGIDPTGLEISGTLMLRGACGESVGDWPSISIMQLGGGSTFLFIVAQGTTTRGEARWQLRTFRMPMSKPHVLGNPPVWLHNGTYREL